jgi:hypothetical protein
MYTEDRREEEKKEREGGEAHSSGVCRDNQPTRPRLVTEDVRVTYPEASPLNRLEMSCEALLESFCRGSPHSVNWTSTSADNL